MEFVRPETGVSSAPEPHASTLPDAAQTSESCMELEAALPAASHDEVVPERASASMAHDESKSVEQAPSTDSSELGARFEHLLDTVKTNRPADDLELIRSAWAFSIKKHEGQRRASGEAYIGHPLEVAQVLAELKMDATAIAAGLLHDAVEDTDVTAAEIAKRFGEQVAHIVEGVTKLDKIKFANREDHQEENIRKMLLAMVTDLRVVIIKLADRLHNMRTLEHLKPEKQQKIARETLDVYAPLAHRLGMGKLRGELEDLAFRY